MDTVMLNFFLLIMISVTCSLIYSALDKMKRSTVTQLPKDKFLQLLQKREIKCVSEVKCLTHYHYTVNYEGLFVSCQPRKKLTLPSHVEVLQSKPGWL